MANEPIQCPHCGAMMTPQQDGRTYACVYCKTQQVVAVDAGQISNAMRLDLTKADQALSQICAYLLQAFPEHTQATQHEGAVSSLQFNFEPDVFLARREGNKLLFQHRRVVRGIALKTTTHPLEQWIALLSRTVAAQANASTQSAQFAAWLLGGRRNEP